MSALEADIPLMTGDPHRVAAAEWLVRLQNGEPNVEEITQWQQWLAASEDNRRAFEELEALWIQLEELPNKTAPALPKPKSWREPWRLAAAASIGVLVIGAGFLAFQSWRSQVTSAEAGRFLAQTATGEHRDMTLPDGSQMVLGGRSIARVRFMPQEREIRLDSGEAFFSVRKDASRPFVVRAGETRITAIGTAFNVRRAGERIHVSVTEGAVRISAPGIGDSTSAIKAGQQLTVDPVQKKSALRTESTSSATAWRDGRLEYLGESLKYVVDDVNRYAARRIVIQDPSVGELRLSGTVFEEDIDSWLRSVEDLLPVEVKRLDTGEVLLAPRDR